jgi:hypothetical protein
MARAANRRSVDRRAPFRPARVRHRRRHQLHTRRGAIRRRPSTTSLLPDRPRHQPATNRSVDDPARTRCRLRHHPRRPPNRQARCPPPSR